MICVQFQVTGIFVQSVSGHSVDSSPQLVTMLNKPGHIVAVQQFQVFAF